MTWIIKPNRKIDLFDSSGNILKSAVIGPLCIYVLSKSDKEKTFVFTEPVTEDRQRFTKYLIMDNVDLTIGRNEQNDIFFENKVVSAKHATLSFRDGHWFLQDEKSTNGTFVNEKRISKAKSTIDQLASIWEGEASQATISAYDEFAAKYFQNYEETIEQYVKFLRTNIDAGYFKTETENIGLADAFK